MVAAGSIYGLIPSSAFPVRRRGLEGLSAARARCIQRPFNLLFEEILNDILAVLSAMSAAFMESTKCCTGHGSDSPPRRRKLSRDRRAGKLGMMQPSVANRYARHDP